MAVTAVQTRGTRVKRGAPEALRSLLNLYFKSFQTISEQSRPCNTMKNQDLLTIAL